MEPTPAKERSLAYFQNLPPSNLLQAADTTWRICALWELLREGAWTVRGLMAETGLDRGSIKTYLKRMKKAGLIEVTKKVLDDRHWQNVWERREGQQFDPSPRPIPKSAPSELSPEATTSEEGRPSALACR